MSKVRIQSLDLLRGLVMIVMALDHVRDYFHTDSFTTDPTDLSKTTVLFFATRWITHFCAPVFMMLAGTSAYLSGQRKSKSELSIFLLTRGIWLIVLEISIISFGWSFELDFQHLSLAVIWALGASMIALAGLIWLPMPAILLTGLLLVGAHNCLDHIHLQKNTGLAIGWNVLHEMGGGTWHGLRIFVMYPILPWIGVMALGYCLGTIYHSRYSAEKRKKVLLTLGLSVLTLFIALRYSNGYGDSALWSSQSEPAFTILSFLNTTKYPPSLLYLCMTLGPAFLFLAFSESATGRLTDFVKIYGRVPMFYYICHLYLIHAGALVMAWLQGFKPSDFEQGVPDGFGLSLGQTYLVWIGIILLLYPACKWYDRYKTNHRHNRWLSYL